MEDLKGVRLRDVLDVKVWFVEVEVVQAGIKKSEALDLGMGAGDGWCG